MRKALLIGEIFYFVRTPSLFNLVSGASTIVTQTWMYHLNGRWNWQVIQMILSFLFHLLDLDSVDFIQDS